MPATNIVRLVSHLPHPMPPSINQMHSESCSHVEVACLGIYPNCIYGYLARGVGPDAQHLIDLGLSRCKLSTAAGVYDLSFRRRTVIVNEERETAGGAVRAEGPAISVGAESSSSSIGKGGSRGWCGVRYLEKIVIACIDAAMPKLKKDIFLACLLYTSRCV